MSHFFCVVVVPGDTTADKIEDVVGRLLAPYNEALARYDDDGNRLDDTVVRWDWWEVGGRWNGVIRNLEKKEAHWTFEEGCSVNDNILPAKQLDHSLKPHAVVTPNGKWHESGKMGWFGISRDDIPKEEWNAQVIQLIQEHSSGILVGVDCHI